MILTLEVIPVCFPPFRKYDAKAFLNPIGIIDDLPSRSSKQNKPSALPFSLDDLVCFLVCTFFGSGSRLCYFISMRTSPR